MDNKAFLHMINSEEYIKLYDYYNQKTLRIDIVACDLHFHSNCSYGTLTPEELVVFQKSRLKSQI